MHNRHYMATNSTSIADNQSGITENSVESTFYNCVDKGLIYDHTEEVQGWKMSYFRIPDTKEPLALIPAVLEELLIVGLLLVLLLNNW